MSDEPQWLKNYYGNDFDFLNPSIVREGKKLALVKLSRRGSAGFSGIGYVLIKKGGSHVASPYKVLAEGVQDKAGMDKLFETLAEEDKK